jgi:hypothetical protein
MAPGVEDKEIVRIAAMRHCRFESSYGALKAYALVIVDNWIERKYLCRGEKPTREPQDQGDDCDHADEPSDPLPHGEEWGKADAKSHSPQISYLGGGIRRSCQPADDD